MPMRRANSLKVLVIYSSPPRLLCGFNDARDRAHHAFELRDLHAQLPATRRGELVVARPAVACRRAPFCGHPALDEHALQCRIERTFLDLQHVLSGLLDRVGDLEAMQLAIPRESFQDQEIERPGRDVVAGVRHSVFRRYIVCLRRQSMTDKSCTVKTNRVDY